MTDPEKLDELEARLRALVNIARQDIADDMFVAETTGERVDLWNYCVELSPDEAENLADAIRTLREQLAAAREGLGGLLRLFLPIDMQTAQAEMAEHPVDPNAVLFSFMGSGASDHVTVGEYLAATDSARTLAALKETDNG